MRTTVSAWHFTLSPPFHIFNLPRRQLTQPRIADDPGAKRGVGTCPDTQPVCIKKERGWGRWGFQPRCSQSDRLPPPTPGPLHTSESLHSCSLVNKALIGPVLPASCSLELSLCPGTCEWGVWPHIPEDEAPLQKVMCHVSQKLISATET